VDEVEQMSNTATTAKIVAAVIAGYVLGRRKKFKLALAVGAYMAAKKLDVSPQALLKELSELPAVGELKDQTRDQVVSIGKDTTDKLVNSLASDLASSLNARTQRLVSAPASAAGGAASTAASTLKGSRRGDEEAEEEPEETGGERAEESADADDTAEPKRSTPPRAKKTTSARSTKTTSATASRSSGSRAKSGTSGGRSDTARKSKSRSRSDDDG
jgi:hypothetical protein